MSDVNIRELVTQSLISMEKDNLFLSAIETAVLDKYDYIDPRDKAFYKRLMDGTTEKRIQIDYILGLFSNTKINKLKPAIRAIMRMSIYQIMWMDSVPDSAACNEAVKLVKRLGPGGLSGYVNGTLRNIARNKQQIDYPDSAKNWIKYASIVYSCPEWIIEKIVEEYGQAVTEGFLDSTSKHRSLSVRVRTDETKFQALIDEWKALGIEVLENPYLPYACFLNNAGAVAELPGFEDGAFVVQDTGSMMVAHMAGIRAGDIVMDVCAAPGGKSMHAADIINGLSGDGHVYSYDISDSRCERIIQNINRLGINNVSVECHDATILIEEMVNAADVVFVDAPCSGLGVIGHKSDIKYRITPEDIESLAVLQRKIIDNSMKYLKDGARLVYSTCTITRAENNEQTGYIMDTYPVDLVYEKQFMPGIDESDGFYIAVFEKKRN